ncbi:predicted protein [Naegleria gruberi]|uniref:Predicted protein n=1 Tax=Naegleria gruberi TaxID=5762 RepID=D2VKB8_NAEGR|nr:uncharacterized protein NAEGRDRAFT_69338 [Naegleria gruberi]EFC42658.1 predicted protein [Naegleria gruberi]|eukprot:XP_002675402.1 predicted protein [Naegleria gruberi strain NEG-M]
MVSSNIRYKSKNERSIVYLVQIRESDNNRKDHEVVKQYTNLKPFNMEQSLNSLVINNSRWGNGMNTLIMSVAKNLNTIKKEQLFDLLHSAACALKKLHDEDIVHGDIKPQHLLIKDGDVVLIDFEFCTILGSTKGFHPP